MNTIICFNVMSSEIDKMGIVHHSNYIKWFEKGRIEYLKKAQIDSFQEDDKKLFLPLTGLECKFKHPAKYGDKIIVITRIISMSCVKVKFEYKVFRKANMKLLATGSTIHAWTNEKIEPINIEKASPKSFCQLKHFSGLSDII